MEQEILSELSTIKLLLWVIIILMCLGFVFFVGTNVVRNLTKIHTIKREQFLSEAQALDDKGKLEQLIDLVNDRQKAYPRDPLIFWFLGVAYYKKKNYSQALTAFSEMKNIDGTLYQELVDDYIQEIKRFMSGPGNENS